MAELKVEVASHFFCVTKVSTRAVPAVRAFAKKFVQMGLERVPVPGRAPVFTWSPLRIFGAGTRDRSEMRFHIHALEEFKQGLSNAGITDVQWDIRPMFQPVQVVLTIQPGWTPREHQPPVIEYLARSGEPIQRLVELQTGQGKSYCAMSAMTQVAERTVIIVRPMYIEKWLQDLKRTYVLEKGDLIVAQGSTHLQALLAMAEEGELVAKVILISNKTIQNWIKQYEAMKDEILLLGWTCRPDQLCEKLRAGVRVIDEVHQDFHLNFKLDMYTHVCHSMSLSATLISDDSYLEQMYEVAYPKANRYKGPEYKRYVEAWGVMYRLKDPNRVKTRQRGSSMYSHHAFEDSIISDKKPGGMLENYLKMITQLVKTGHFRKAWVPGYRCLVFCAGIEMCTIVANHLQKIFPDQRVTRYVEEDPFENLDGDIVVSTPLSAGTAVDIDKLTTAILTQAMKSSPSNLQGFGRLRDPREKGYDITPQFYYLTCLDVPKHMEYHQHKAELLQSRALAYNTMPFPGMI